jgi:alpha-L-rhamnosidase
MTKFAKATGNEADIDEYAKETVVVKEAFNKKFLNATTHQYGNNTVTANVLPLAFGMVPEKEENAVFKQMVDKIVIKDQIHLSSGLIGIQWRLPLPHKKIIRAGVTWCKKEPLPFGNCGTAILPIRE